MQFLLTYSLGLYHFLALSTFTCTLCKRTMADFPDPFFASDNATQQHETSQAQRMSYAEACKGSDSQVSSSSSLRF